MAEPQAKPVEQVEVVETPAKIERVFKRGGQEIKVELTPELETELLQKGYDYTAKTMELAQFRKEAQAVIEEVRAEQKAQAEAVIALFNDPERLQLILDAKRAQAGLAPSAPPAAEDDLEFVSKSQLAAMMKEMEAKVRAEVKAETEKAKGSVREDIELRQMESSFRSDFDKHIDSLMQTFPVLQEFGGEDIANKIRADAHKFAQSVMVLNPGVALDPRQVKSVMMESAKRRAEAIEGKLREREKQVVMSHVKLVEKGPEPKGGGAAPAPPAAKPLKLKDPALDAQVLQEIESIMGKR